MLYQRLALLVSVATLGSGCNRHHDPEPSPLGTFTNDQLAEWSHDCATALVDERVCGSLTAGSDCPAHFHSIETGAIEDHQEDWATTATRRIRCGPPGWSLWTDDRGRIIGLCADYVRGEARNEENRLLDLLTEHWNKHVADQMFAVISGHDTSHSGHWSAWQQPVHPQLIRDDPQRPPRVVPDPHDTSQASCLEFMLHK